MSVGTGLDVSLAGGYLFELLSLQFGWVFDLLGLFLSLFDLFFFPGSSVMVFFLGFYVSALFGCSPNNASKRGKGAQNGSRGRSSQTFFRCHARRGCLAQRKRGVPLRKPLRCVGLI